MTWRELLRIPIQLLKDYCSILKSGIFMHAAYSKRHFKTEYLLWLSLPHYILIGESKGYLPNPFFDPAYLKAEAHTGRLVDYLRETNLWRYSTSDYFDSRWYTEKYAGCLKTTENPLLHFWHQGFEKGYRPSQRFDTKFFFRAIARDQPNIKEYAYNYASMGRPDLPLNMSELDARQKSFYDNITIETLKTQPAQKKRFLVFVQAGNNYDPNYDYENASFDVLINYYDKSSNICDAQYIFRQKGTKTTAIRKLLETKKDILLGYEAVLFLDDDIIISQAQIEMLFAVQARHGLDLLQASLSEDSECHFPILKQPLAGAGLRPLSAIEIMMPVISRRALRECGWVFEEGISGWCVDLLLSREVREKFGNTIALFGDVVAVHPRAVDTAHNAFYQFLARHDIDPRVEAGKIAMKYALNDKLSAVDFRILEPNLSESLPAFDEGVVERRISLRYANRLEEAIFDCRSHRVTSSQLKGTRGGQFLSDGRLLTIHWDQSPAESFMRQDEEYIHILPSQQEPRH